jgi:hypothetical protein
MVQNIPKARAVAKKARDCNPPVRKKRKRGEKDLQSEKNIESFLALLDAEGYEEGTDTEMAMTCLPSTKKHYDLSVTVMDDFISCLWTAPNGKWARLLSPVANPFRLDSNSPTEIPAIFLMCSGEITLAKVKLANLALIEWQGRTQKKGENKEEKFRWYQPGTQNQRMRTFFGTMKQRFDWRFNFDSFTFVGGVTSFVKALYAKRLSEFGNVSSVLFSFFISYSMQLTISFLFCVGWLRYKKS